MKILYALNSSDFGGMELHTLDLVRGLTELGHEVFVWCPKGDQFEDFKSNSKETIEAKIKLDIDPGYIFSLAKYLKENKVDVVHGHELKAATNAVLAGFLAGTRVRISHTHTPISEWQIGNFKKKLNSVFYSFVVNMFSTKEVALTESRKRIKQKEGINAEKLTVIPNGVEYKRFAIAPEVRQRFSDEMRARYGIGRREIVFGTISRISIEKGTDVLLKGFANFLKRPNVSNCKLMIAGGGALADEMKDLARKLDISDEVIFTGSFKEEDKVKLYSLCDVFVFPSLAEGFGIVLVEAMAVGLPIISSDLEVLQEVGGSACRYFEIGKSEDLAEKMFNMYSKIDNLSSLGVQAQMRVKELYTMENFIQNYEEFYEELLV